MMTLTFENLKILSSSNQASQKAKIIADVLSKNYLRNSDNLYKIHENLTLELIDRSRSENVMLKDIQDIYYNSDNKLSNDQKMILQTKDFVSYSKLSNTNTIKGIIQNIDELLFKEIDDNNKDKIHFKNGFLRISNGKLYKRIKATKDFINRDYKKATESDIKYIENIYKQIYPLEDERDYILSTISSSITGESKKERSSLFLLGKSSAGKSLLMQSLNKSFSNTYVKEFSSDTFSKNNKNKDKILNEFLKLQNVRICWVNELSGKLDDSIFKSFCEGTVKTTSLYKDGFNDIEHLSKVILTSNELPNIRIDTGVSSRIVSHNHRSYFTEDDEEIDEDKYIFKRDNNLINTINNNDGYKNAIVDIIIKYALIYLEKGSLGKMPKSMEIDKQNIISSNDYIQDFIDSKLNYNDDGIIGKQELLNSYVEMYPTHKRTMQQMISALKDKNINYLYDKRKNGVKGCFIGIELKEVSNNNYVRSPDDITNLNKQQQEIDYLKKKVAQLEEQLKNKENNNDKEQTNKKKPKKETKKESKIEIIEPTTLFSNDDLMDSFNESLNDLL